MPIDPPAVSLLRLAPFSSAFVFVFAGGFLIPLPQEAVLILIGYFFADRSLPAVTPVLASVAAVIVSDNLFYVMSLLGSPLVMRVKARLDPALVERYAKRMRAHTGRTIFLIRFVPGLRVLAPLLSGLFSLDVWTYELYNALAALIYVPAYVMLGYYFNHKIDQLITGVEFEQNAIFVAVLLMIAAATGFFVYRSIFRKKTAEERKIPPGRDQRGGNLQS